MKKQEPLKFADIQQKMRMVNMWFHFTRNNPRNRDKFYHLIVGSVGYDKWVRVKPEYRSAVDIAKNSFDKLYGLIKALALTKGSEAVKDFFELIEESEKEPEQRPLSQFDAEMEVKRQDVQKAEEEAKLEVLKRKQVQNAVLIEMLKKNPDVFKEKLCKLIKSDKG